MEHVSPLWCAYLYATYNSVLFTSLWPKALIFLSKKQIYDFILTSRCATTVDVFNAAGSPTLHIQKYIDMTPVRHSTTAATSLTIVVPRNVQTVVREPLSSTAVVSRNVLKGCCATELEQGLLLLVASLLHRRSYGRVQIRTKTCEIRQRSTMQLSLLSSLGLNFEAPRSVQRFLEKLVTEGSWLREEGL